MNRFVKLIPWLIVITFGVYLMSKAIPARDESGQMNIHEFGQLPVVYQGRIKPFDTLARNGLLVVSDKQSFIDNQGEERPAIQWLLDVMSQSQDAFQYKVFRIHNLELLDMLELERRKGYRYAVVEFRDNIGKLDESANQARGRDPSERDTFDIQAMALAEKLGVFSRFGQSHSYPPRLNSREDVDNLRRQHDSLMRFPLPHSVPPGVEGEEWQPFMHAVLLAMISPEPNPAIKHLGALLNAYHNKDVEVFNEQLVQYREHLASVGFVDFDSKRLSFEAQFNHFQPFYYSSVIYIVAMLLCIFAWIGWGKTLNRAAFLLIAMTLVVHTGAIIARIYISGYPPITNLYGTAIFIGWGCVLTGLLIEGLFKLGVGNFVASV
ncbi:MAG: hypothetical protein ACKVGW_00715, partial [Verrucomicrobiia bacterium]